MFLQNEYGADVNQLLYCLWYGAVFGQMNDEHINKTMEFSNNWSVHVVQPLRKVRTWMKVNSSLDDYLPAQERSTLRERVKEAELMSENLQENVLEKLAGPKPAEKLSVDEQVKAAVANLRLYYAEIEMPMKGNVLEQSKHIVCAAFPDIKGEDIISELAGSSD